MKFYKGQIFHIYNQGNNKEKIFLEERNYLFFLSKMRKHISPYADFLAYCLMPNHFHFLIYLKEVNVGKTTFNSSIGTMLMSYSFAINKQENRTGSLFRKKTQAKDGWIEEVVTLKGLHGNILFSPFNQYGAICFDYIHNNPVQANFVKRPEDWIYSSAMDYKGLRQGTLCNQALAKELLGI